MRLEGGGGNERNEAMTTAKPMTGAPPPPPPPSFARADIEREGLGVTETVAIAGIVGTVMLGVGILAGALLGQNKK